MKNVVCLFAGLALVLITNTSAQAKDPPLINVIYAIEDIQAGFTSQDGRESKLPYTEKEILNRFQQTSVYKQLDPSQQPFTGLSIKLYGSTASLVVRGTQEQHDRLADFLEKIRTKELMQVSYEIRHIRLSKEGLKKAELAYDKILTKDDSMPVGVVEITDLEAFHFIQNAQADRHSNILFAPKLTAFNGQTVEAKNDFQRPFVTGVNLKTEDQLQSELTVINEGLKIVLHGSAIDEKSIKVHAEATWTQLNNVDVVSVDLKGSDGVMIPATLQVPEVEKALVKIDGTLDDDKSILIVFLKPQTVPARQPSGIIQTAFQAVGLSAWGEMAPDDEIYSAVMITARFFNE